MPNIEGYIPIQSPLMTNNDNPRSWVSDVKYIKGSPQVFDVIASLVAFHPNRLKSGNSATILNYPTAGVITDFRLIVEPSTMLDASNNSIVTVDNFTQFWQVQSSLETSRTRVYQYSPDGPGGGAPIFPYVTLEESKWVNTFDNSKGHRWLRFRDDDIDIDVNNIYDNWTAPIPVNNTYASGDYLENRFRRQDVSATVHVAIGTLTTTKYYIVDAGQIQITGDLSLNDIGTYGATTTVILGTGRRFKYAVANAYSFISATAKETVAAPPRTISGLPNNEPIGWDDTIPAGAEQLWQITAQKSVYGQLKSEWIIQKIIESPSYIRYNNLPTPHPDTLASTTDDANTGSVEDLALIAASWVSVYNNHTFIAKRQDDGANYTPWLVEKINEESGEYTDRVFKLFDLNLDLDSPFLAAPVNRDPTSEGWSDTPLVETDTQINYVSEARKFFNGELKTSWSSPIPYTGKDIFSDVIDSNFGDNFKYTQEGVVTPTLITLKANLYKGTSELWQNAALTITYLWKKVYDDGAVVNIIPTESTSDDFYLLGSNGSPGDATYARNHQRLSIKPTGVNGNAIFRVIQTLVMGDAPDLIFEEDFSVLDITDGKDAKNLSVTADADKVLYDTVSTTFLPTNIVLRAYQSNIPSMVYKWYRWNGASWAALTNGVNGYTITGNTLVKASSGLFVADNTAQQEQFAVSNHLTNPLSSDYETTFADFITIVKLSSAGVGSNGIDALTAILSNEAHVVVLYTTTGLPQPGEITSSGKAKTTLQVYNGINKLDYGTDYTIALASDNADVAFAFVANVNGLDVDVYANTWVSPARSAVCTITITYGTYIFSRKFSLSSTKDAPGAILLDIDSDKGFVFTPSDKTDKILTAKLYDSALTGSQQISLPDATYTFRFNVAGAWGSTSTTNTRTITRSNILVSSQVIVECYKSGILFRSRTITISDVNDGRSYRAWTNNVIKPSSIQDLSNENPVAGSWPYTINTVVWRLPSDIYWATNTPTWAQDATELTGVYTWLPVYQLKGEKGDQGFSGGFFHPMYIAFDSLTQTGRLNSGASPWDNNSDGVPDFGLGGTSSTLAQMLTAGWLSKPPSIGILWRTERAWVGEGVTYNGSGDPSTAPVSGSTWHTPIKISAKDGTNGVGTTGESGWTPVPALVTGSTSGTKVIQIIDYTGGSGTKPTVGLYVSSTGLTPTLSLAQNVTGEPVQMQYNSSTRYLQWKYNNESSLAWRNLTTMYQNPNGTKYLQQLFHNYDTFTKANSKTYDSSSSFTMCDNNTGLRPKIDFISQATGDGGGVDIILIIIEIFRVGDSSFSSVVNTTFTINSGTYTVLTASGIATIANSNYGTFYVRARLIVSTGGLAHFSDYCGFTVTLVPY